MKEKLKEKLPFLIPAASGILITLLLIIAVVVALPRPTPAAPEADGGYSDATEETSAEEKNTEPSPTADSGDNIGYDPFQ